MQSASFQILRPPSSPNLFTMRDFASCFSEYTVQVSDTSCSSYSKNSCMTPALIPSIQNAVTCLYRTILSTQKQFLISATWYKNNISQGLNITFSSDPSTTIKLNFNSRLFRKLKGSKSLEFDNSNIEVFWDFSTARYHTGPEPLDGYYVFLIVDSELSLILGDMGEDTSIKKLKSATRMAKFSLVSRQEHISGSSLYSTKAKFCEKGVAHDILIHCSGENEGLKHSVLSVCIDKKMVIRVKRLQWNFRGNQIIFLDGLLVDLMWDVHDWFYNPAASGYAVFMFRTRSGTGSRLWLEEKLVPKDEEKDEFSLMIYAAKNV
ncbi:uncharacterized protein LOC111397565 [Olea europaea var. sylvestris]|uniref:uncharacterized protein LOC111397565 n=1 Tax=Olea europaea var. sylvestris TaxID=158386 RepID=UPI000C1CFFB8|nr:uncharacterized protein LOC111397565 [Olea europaea var. sylvestris]